MAQQYKDVYTYQELKRKKDKDQCNDSTLKVQTRTMRVWLAKFGATVTVEQLMERSDVIGGRRWETVRTYEAEGYEGNEDE